jgi:hypothetical protein
MYHYLDKADIYEWQKPTKGYCCVFLNQKFEDDKKDELRTGAEIDINSLKEKFEQLQFEIYKDDKTDESKADEILATV